MKGNFLQGLQDALVHALICNKIPTFVTMASKKPKPRQNIFDMSIRIADNLYSQYEALTSVPEFRLRFDPPYKERVTPVPDADTRVSAFMMDTVYLITYCALGILDAKTDGYLDD